MMILRFHRIYPREICDYCMKCSTQSQTHHNVLTMLLTVSAECQVEHEQLNQSTALLLVD